MRNENVKSIVHVHDLLICFVFARPINNFIIWSLARQMLPHLSKEYRTLAEHFDHAIYGRTASYPRWLFCSKVVRDWVPFAVDALQQQPAKQQFEGSNRLLGNTHDNALNKTVGNEKFLQLMFYSLRNQLQESLTQASWLQPAARQFMDKKLSEMRLQFGIPNEVLDQGDYISKYYNDLLLSNLNFVEHLESIWTFRRARMADKLKTLSMLDV